MKPPKGHKRALQVLLLLFRYFLPSCYRLRIDEIQFFISFYDFLISVERIFIEDRRK